MKLAVGDKPDPVTDETGRAERSVPFGVISSADPSTENQMSRGTNKAMMALALCGAFILVTPVVAQPADAGGAPAEAAVPDANGPPPADGQPKSLGQGTKAQAEHSAEATAHKSVSDPNNQLGTSLQGRTRPIAGADADSLATASNAEPAADAQ